MNTQIFKTSALEVLTEAFETLKARMSVLVQTAIFSGILAVILLSLAIFYVSFSQPLNWMIFGAAAVVVTNYLVTGQVCEVCLRTMNGVANIIRFFRDKIVPTY